MKSQPDRHELAISTAPAGAPLYLLVDPPEKVDQRLGPGWAKSGEDLRVVHVISPAARGEIRGYWLIRGHACQRRPDHLGAWPELDAEVSRVLGVPVHVADSAPPSGAVQEDLFG